MMTKDYHLPSNGKISTILVGFSEIIPLISDAIPKGKKEISWTVWFRPIVFRRASWDPYSYVFPHDNGWYHGSFGPANNLNSTSCWPKTLTLNDLTANDWQIVWMQRV